MSGARRPGGGLERLRYAGGRSRRPTQGDVVRDPLRPGVDLWRRLGLDRAPSGRHSSRAGRCRNFLHGRSGKAGGRFALRIPRWNERTPRRSSTAIERLTVGGTRCRAAVLRARASHRRRRHHHCRGRRCERREVRAAIVLLLVGGCAIPLAAQESRDAPLYAGRPLVDVLQDLNRRGLRIVFSTSLVPRRCACPPNQREHRGRFWTRYAAARSARTARRARRADRCARAEASR